jgi:plastocyanin
MSNKYVRLFLIASLFALLLAACSGAQADSPNSPASRDGDPGATVHMNDTKFIAASVTLRKGEHVTLVADTFMPHIIANGTWQNSVPQPARAPGAPAVNALKIDGNEAGTIGPFATAGTFQFYCTIHPGMNLTVVVE